MNTDSFCTHKALLVIITELKKENNIKSDNGPQNILRFIRRSYFVVRKRNIKYVTKVRSSLFASLIRT